MFAAENILDWVSKSFAGSHKIAVKVQQFETLASIPAPQNRCILNWELEFLPL
jgi:hypothetical protein